MARLPAGFRALFCRVLDGDMPPQRFGQWLLEDDDLEKLLPTDDYFALVTAKYDRPGALEKVAPVLQRYLVPGELSTHKLVELLHHASWEDHDLPKFLLQLGELYDRGLTFLKPMAERYSEHIRRPVVYGETRQWDDLTDFEQDDILHSFGPGLDEDVTEIIGWLQSGQIILTAETDGDGPLTFIDRRPDA
jgi:hypothetical protein